MNIKPRYNKTQKKVNMHISNISQVVFDLPKQGAKTLVTDIICIDGKKHLWKDVIIEQPNQNTQARRTCWCQKCGSMTEFLRPRSKPSAKWERCEGIEVPGKHIEIPEIFSDWATINEDPFHTDANSFEDDCGY